MISVPPQQARLALIGLGRWGKQLIRVLDQTSDLRICCTQSAHYAVPFLRENYPHVAHTSSAEEIFQRPDIDGVVIATPTSAHAALAKAALRAGKHVLVEKPMTTDVASAEELCELAAQVQTVLCVGFVFLHHQVFEKILALTQNAAATHLSVMWAKFGTFDSDISQNLASHYVSMAIKLFDAVPTRATMLSQRSVLSSCDIMSARLEFANGQDCVMHIDRCSPVTHQVVTVLRDGAAPLVWHQQTLYQLSQGAPPQVIFEASDAPLTREVLHFLAACRGDVSPLADATHGLAVAQTLENLIPLGGERL